MENKTPSICCVPDNPRLWTEMGLWLDKHMPNPPMDEPWRWRLITTDTLIRRIKFADPQDATLFSLRWGG